MRISDWSSDVCSSDLYPMAKIFGGLRGSRFPLATNYEDQGPDEIVFPEDLAALDDAGVDSLLNGALEAFQDIYGDGTNLSDAQVDALSALRSEERRVGKAWVSKVRFRGAPAP